MVNMKISRFLILAFVLVALLSCFVPAFAAEPYSDYVELTYWEWLHCYKLCDCEDHYNEYIGIKTCNAGDSPLVPVVIPYETYTAFYDGSVNPERNFEIKQELDTRGIEYDESRFALGDFVNSYSNLNLGAMLTDYISKEAIASLAKGAVADAKAEAALSSNSDDSPVLYAAAQPVPDSGTAYSKPVLVDTEYAPDATEGTLLSVIYGLLGKPVKSYTYSYVSSYNNSQTVYKLELLDYDINWIASFLLLCAVIICIFKAGGALLCKL